MIGTDDQMNAKGTITKLIIRLLAALLFTPVASGTLRNEVYDLGVAETGAVIIRVAGMEAMRVDPVFVVICSDDDPHLIRNPSHPDFVSAPRSAARWKSAGEKSRPFEAGRCVMMKPVSYAASRGSVEWMYEPQKKFIFTAAMTLQGEMGDPCFTFSITPKCDGYFSVAFTGSPDTPIGSTRQVPQECDARGHKQFNFVMSEADLHLPRAHVATSSGNIALVASPKECRFRLPSISDSRFGFMLANDGGKLKPVLLAPLPGGTESKMKSGQTFSFAFRLVVRSGDWKDTYAHIARDIFGFRDMRDNSGPGSLNNCLERVADFLVNRNGHNFAMWDEQQKYYDYFTDKTGVFKPFSPLYGLSVAIVTDDEAFFRNRARPAVEYAISRRNNLFAPYDAADNKQARRATRDLGAPYIGREQIESLDELFQHRTPAFRALADSTGAARKTENISVSSEDGFFDLLEHAGASRNATEIATASDAAYHKAMRLNLYPMPVAGAMVTMDRGGFAPVHAHSFGRHKNIWGFPSPQPVPTPEQTVSQWRIARIGLEGTAYPIEYWMNMHGAIMRAAALAHDEFLRDIARWGMVGRFGNYPGDNRSQDSLITELPDAVERPPWDWNFATVNPGHAWDFAGAVLDFLVSDAFERSGGAIDFPALSAAGSKFRVQIYGGRAGKFYGDDNVRLWMPRGLVDCDNKQFDWIAGYGNGNFYVAFLNQSFCEERATVAFNRELVECHDGKNRIELSAAPKGITHFTIPAVVKPRLQSKLYDEHSPPLPSNSFAEVSAPFGKVRASLFRAGRDLTSSFVYCDAVPENVIAARLVWRQGAGEWKQMTDEIYPYEFSAELRDDGGDFDCVFEIEDAHQKIHRSPRIALQLRDEHRIGSSSLPPELGPIVPQPIASEITNISVPDISDEFVAYLENAANGYKFGLRGDGKFYPYSTPQGRRIGFREPVWDNDLFARGCSPDEADKHFRATIARAEAALKKMLAGRSSPVDFSSLDKRQQETLLDFVNSEGVAGMCPEFLRAVIARDWNRVVSEHFYIRFAGHTPDHSRNKAFARRWSIP